MANCQNASPNLKTDTRNFLRYWLPAALWTALVLFASSATFSGENTGHILEGLLAALFGEVPRSLLLTGHLAIRKLGHLSEYGTLGWLLYRARRQSYNAWNWSWAWFALAGVLGIATIDELHQHFVPSRVGSPLDVLIDLTGAIVALAILHRMTARTQFAAAP
jgi:VanZ family protein